MSVAKSGIKRKYIKPSRAFFQTPKFKSSENIQNCWLKVENLEFHKNVKNVFYLPNKLLEYYSKEKGYLSKQELWNNQWSLNHNGIKKKQIQ